MCGENSNERIEEEKFIQGFLEKPEKKMTTGMM
jgi:hypothetical protein